MILEALRRARTRKRIVFISLLLFGTGLLGAVGLTSAFFEGEFDTQTATFAGGYLASPYSVSAIQPNTSTSSGYNGVVTWTNGVEPVPTSVLTGTSNTANAPYTITAGTTSLLFAAGLKGYIKSGDAVFVRDATNNASATCTAGGTPAVGDTTLTVSLCTSITNGTLFSTAGATTNVTDTSSNEVQQIFGADRGTTSNCTGAVYSTTVLNSTTSPTTTQAFTYTDVGRATSPSNINGDWYCYEVLHGFPSTTAPVWKSPSGLSTVYTTTAVTSTVVNTSPIQIGLAPISVMINGGCTGDGTIDTSNSTAGCRFHLADTIVITYNQPVTMTSGSGASDYCTYGTEHLISFGDATCTAAFGAESYTIGRLTAGTVSGAEHTRKTATIAVSGNQITITISQNGSTVTGSSTFDSSTNGGTVNSSTGAAVPCTTVASTCTLTVSGSF